MKHGHVWTRMTVMAILAALLLPLRGSDIEKPALPAIRIAAYFAGADAGAKIEAAIADLPAGGGTVDARGLEGAQTISENIFSGITKPVKLLLGCGTYTVSVAQAIATPGIEIIGADRKCTELAFSITSGDAINVNVGAVSTGQDSFVMRHLTVSGPNSGTGDGLRLRSAPQFVLENVFVEEFGNDGIVVDGDVATDSTNTNIGTFKSVSSYGNGRYGFFLEKRGASGDANLISFISTDAYGNGADNYRINTRWNVFAGANSGGAGAYGFNFENGRDNYGYIYSETSTTKDLRFGAASERNVLTWLNGADAALDFEDACGDTCGNAVLMAYELTDGTAASWGWQNFPLVDVRPAGSAVKVHNDADSTLSLSIQPGSTADQIGQLQFNGRTGASMWTLGKTATNNFSLTANSTAQSFTLTPSTTGTATIGSTGSAGTALSSQRYATGPVGLSRGLFGDARVASTSGADSDIAYGVSGLAAISATNNQNWTNATAALQGVTADVQSLSGATGTVTGVAGFLTTAANSGMTWTNYYGLLALAPSGGGTIVNNYGLKIQDRTAGTTINRAIETGLGDVVFGGPLIQKQEVVTFSTTPTFNAALGNSFKMTLTDNVSSSTISNAQTGQFITLLLCQDGTGSRTMVWPTDLKLAGGAYTLTTTLDKCDSLTAVYDGTDWYETARAADL